MFCSARALAASVVAFCLIGASPAIAEKYDSIAAAKAAGDPAAVAPSSGSTDATWTFHGRNITPEYARAHARVCVEDDTSVTRCYDTNAQAEGSAATAVASSRRAANKSVRSKAKASCSASDGSQLKLYMDSSYNGFQLNLDSREAGTTFPAPTTMRRAHGKWAATVATSPSTPTRRASATSSLVPPAFAMPAPTCRATPTRVVAATGRPRVGAVSQLDHLPARVARL